MTSTWHKIKGYTAGAVALITCPCHLPITLPLLITLTAGTAFGTWLANNALVFGAISTVVFIGGIVLAFKWINHPAEAGSHRGRLRKAKIEEARQAVMVRQAGAPKITLLTSSNCTSCKSTQTAWQQAREQADFEFAAVDITSASGRALAARHNIFSTPATIVDDHVVMRGSLNLEDALAIVGSTPQTAPAMKPVL